MDGISGLTFTGFAHGVSGIAYFLAEYARRYRDPRADRAWMRGAEWVIRKATAVGSALGWPYSDSSPELWRWWCHGSAGIALLLLRLYEQTGERRYANYARRALRLRRDELMQPNLSQCHGLAGVGEVYLEAARLLPDPQWSARVADVLDVIANLRRRPAADASLWLAEDPYMPTADLMVGGAGVVHLWLRASMSPVSAGPPLLFDPISVLPPSMRRSHRVTNASTSR